MNALTAVFFLLYLSPIDDLKKGTGGSTEEDEDKPLVDEFFLNAHSPSLPSVLDSAALFATFAADLPSILLAEPLKALNFKLSAASWSAVICKRT